jgi:hypothetical protein
MFDNYLVEKHFGQTLNAKVVADLLVSNVLQQHE